LLTSFFATVRLYGNKKALDDESGMMGTEVGRTIDQKNTAH
jgi:hypothetical protein